MPNMSSWKTWESRRKTALPQPHQVARTSRIPPSCKSPHTSTPQTDLTKCPFWLTRSKKLDVVMTMCCHTVAGTRHIIVVAGSWKEFSETDDRTWEE